MSLTVDGEDETVVLAALVLFHHALAYPIALNALLGAFDQLPDAPGSEQIDSAFRDHLTRNRVRLVERSRRMIEHIRRGS